MDFRRFEMARHFDDVLRIWKEVGWVKSGDNGEKSLRTYLESVDGWVAEIDGHAESYVATAPGIVRYLDEDLSLRAVTAVTTSRVARKQGLATKLTARAMQESCAGVDVAILGMFEQGFYDRLGFGTGTAVHLYNIAPAQLDVPRLGRRPKRVGTEDWQQVHANRAARLRRHGGVVVGPEKHTLSEMLYDEEGFGLGFFDGADGTLSHHVWLVPDGENEELVPYGVKWMAYETYGQFIELLSVLKSLDDQVHKMRIAEPPGFCLQDFLLRPFHHIWITEKSAFEMGVQAFPYWQVRICDVESAISRTRLPGGDEVAFNLKLSDPVEGLTQGVYVVCLGPESSARPGRDENLPDMEASVGAFSRMWFGAAPTTVLAISDDLKAAPELLIRLEGVLRLPLPDPDWEV